MARQGYAKVSNGYWQNTKIKKLRRTMPTAVGLYVMALSFCSDQLNDGHMTEDEVLYQLDASQDELDALCTIEMFEPDGEGGYFIHDYLRHQTSSQKVKEKREREQKRYVENKSLNDNGDSADVLPAESAQNSGRPFNTKNTKNHRSDSSNEESHTNAREASEVDPIPEGTRIHTQFEAFWNAYPKRTNRRTAQFAFKAALKRTSFAALLAGAQKLAADPNLPDMRFVPQPAKWLDADGWLNPPYPSQRDGPRRSKAQENADFNRDFIARLAAEEAAETKGGPSC